jgi:hypothetical protein
VGERVGLGVELGVAVRIVVAVGLRRVEVASAVAFGRAEFAPDTPVRGSAGGDWAGATAEA